GLLLFVYTSGLMFALRFFAGPIVERISSLGLLLVSAVLGFIGLQLLGAATTGIMCVVAATVYACGKTFLWPTMLGVVSERFPKGGAITIGAIGGAGMLSAGLLGGPGIGFQQDSYASTDLKERAPEVYERYKAPEENQFLKWTVVGLDGAKVGVLEDKGAELARAAEINPDSTAELVKWWETAAVTADEDKEPVEDAGLHGGRMALKMTSYVPAAMAVFYLLMLLMCKPEGKGDSETDISADTGDAAPAEGDTA
ncbi:MAG: MFS transporter, partial [Planctomycetaceae bacterium]